MFLHARFYSLLTFCLRFKYLALSLNCYETLNLIWCIHCFTRQFIVKNHTNSTILLHNTQCDKVHLANSIVVNGPRRKDTIYIYIYIPSKCFYESKYYHVNNNPNQTVCKTVLMMIRTLYYYSKTLS